MSIYYLTYYYKDTDHVCEYSTHCRELAISYSAGCYSSVKLGINRSKHIKNIDIKTKNLVNFLNSININCYPYSNGEIILNGRYKIEISFVLLLMREYINHFHKQTNLEEFSKFLLKSKHRVRIGNTTNILCLVFFMYCKKYFYTEPIFAFRSGPISWAYYIMYKIDDKELAKSFSNYLINIMDDTIKENILSENTLYHFDFLRQAFKKAGMITKNRYYGLNWE